LAQQPLRDAALSGEEALPEIVFQRDLGQSIGQELCRLGEAGDPLGLLDKVVGEAATQTGGFGTVKETGIAGRSEQAFTVLDDGGTYNDFCHDVLLDPGESLSGKSRCLYDASRWILDRRPFRKWGLT
jgi:hypothetical protein